MTSRSISVSPCVEEALAAKEGELEAAVAAAFDAYERAEEQTAEFTAAAAADEATVAALRRTAAAFELEAGSYICTVSYCISDTFFKPFLPEST